MGTRIYWLITTSIGSLLYGLITTSICSLLLPVYDFPGDIMHIFLCGITRKELAWLIDICIKDGHFTYDQLNARIKLINLPYGKRVPSIKAPAEGKTRREMNLDMTAAETMYFARASVTVFESLLPKAALKLPFWLCWLKHRDFLITCLQYEFNRSDAEPGGLLDKKADLFIEAFEKVMRGFLQYYDLISVKVLTDNTYGCIT